jgi:hypothetical protein
LWNVTQRHLEADVRALQEFIRMYK